MWARGTKTQGCKRVTGVGCHHPREPTRCDRIVKGRWVITALAVACAAAIAISVQAGHWWSIHNMYVGPRSGGPVPAQVGAATWAAGMISMVVLLAMAAGLAANRRPALIAKTAIVSLLTAAITGGMLISKVPAMTDATVDRDLWLFAGGVVVGLATAIVAWRRAR